MNERIKELYNKAWLKVDPTNPQETFTNAFAESIVKECAEVGERYADGNYEVYNQILKRFGMEEE